MWPLLRRTWGSLPRRSAARVDDALKAVGMYEFREHAPHLLSGGQKQRIAIAGVIAMQPRCIVLDEPTAMLDPIGRADVLRTIKALNRQRGVTVVLITHHMDEAAQADRLVVMTKGRSSPTARRRRSSRMWRPEGCGPHGPGDHPAAVGTSPRRPGCSSGRPQRRGCARRR